MTPGLRAAWARVPADLRLFGAGVALILPLRVAHAAYMRWMNLDGGLYTDVARHVRDGDGLTTSMSVYNFGYEYFPHPTSVYPLWPLLLGYTARVVPLTTAAHFLPLAFYFATLVTAFVYGKRTWPEPLLPSFHPALHGGHVVAAVMAFSKPFIFFTALPYTEGVSWMLFFGWLARLARRGGSPDPAWAAEHAVWLSVLYFSRYQFLILPIAVAGALGVRVLVGPDRGRWLGASAITLGGVGLVLGAWLHHLSGFVAHAGPLSLLRFDQNRANDLLSEFDVIVATGTPWATLLDRLQGVGLSFQIGSSSSWVPTFGAMSLALPIAAIVALAGLRRPTRAAGREALAWLRRPEAVAWLTAVLVALGGAASIYAAHKHFSGSWYFGKRQGMGAVMAFLLPLLWLMRRGGLPAMLGSLLLAGNVGIGAYTMAREIMAAVKEHDGADKYGELVAWLDQHSPDDAPLTVAIDEGALRRMGWRTRSVGYHALSPDNTWADVQTMADRLGVRAIILSSQKRSWGFWAEGAGAVEARFELLPERPNGYTILWRRDTPVPAVPPADPRVVLVHVDGLSWMAAQRGVDRGKLPTLRRMLRNGAYLTALGALDTADTPAAATSVVTGRTPKDHGITDYAQTLDDGTVVPARSSARLAPPLWTLAGASGLRVDVVGWPATSPVEPVNGRMISDLADAGVLGGTGDAAAVADPANAGAATAAADAARTADVWPADAAVAWPAGFPVDRFQAETGLDAARAAAVARGDTPLHAAVQRAYVTDRARTQLAVEQLRAAPAALTLLALEGPDAAQHLGWAQIAPWAYDAAPADADAGLVDASYRAVDAALAEVLDAAGPDATVIVLSTHGAEPCARRRSDTPGCHTTAAAGMLLIHGAHVQPGVKLSGADALDIAPTVSWLLGLPTSREQPGRPLTEAFAWEDAARLGRTVVDAYPAYTPPAAPAAPSPAELRALDRLRAQGEVAPARDAAR